MMKGATLQKCGTSQEEGHKIPYIPTQCTRDLLGAMVYLVFDISELH